MLFVSAAFSYLSIMIYKGKTDLINSYHQTKVTDKCAYGKAFGKALSAFAISPLASGIISLFGESDLIGKISMAVLTVGMGVGIVCIAVVQKKFNNGIF